jgi:hypothetical protein
MCEFWRTHKHSGHNSPEFGQSTAVLAGLCSTMSGASAGRMPMAKVAHTGAEELPFQVGVYCGSNYIYEIHLFQS